jgi:hypothetical protein
VEKAGSTKGWSFTIYEEAWNYGFPQEMAHFIDCVRLDLQPLVTGEDGRTVLPPHSMLGHWTFPTTGRARRWVCCPKNHFMNKLLWYQGRSKAPIPPVVGTDGPSAVKGASRPESATCDAEIA